MSMWTVYLVTRITTLNYMMGFTAVVAGALFCVTLIARAFEAGECGTLGKDALATLRKWNIRSLCASAVCFALWALIPTTKEMAAIYIIPKIANSETMKEVDGVGVELVKLAKEYMAETLKPKQKCKKGE